ncbi:uncharacterized protein DSM5745_10154 [Aspergillus mulundensis]|uniref:Uncharacterized protein n=1 Tax=Aspergillus mulundensis TaxID=1810919 RepID=A0A3D8QMI2_9EURO|nr:hypothetical protein DSM5745_10154 [Aspergillus mulundensis]RDW63043.1 hypothetical protein DSM5745_10154 [Aspergillus mulundensis]
MDGQKAWKTFTKTSSPQTNARAYRLSPHFRDSKEPALDAVDKIDSMSEDAQEFDFRQPHRVNTRVQGFISDPLTEVALYLRASLFYFNLEKIEHLAESQITSFVGSIHCRLYGGTAPLDLLLDKTSEFKILNSRMPVPETDPMNPFRLPITINISSEHLGRMVDLEVLFNDSIVFVPISGFPCSTRDLISAFDRPLEARAQ